MRSLMAARPRKDDMKSLRTLPGSRVSLGAVFHELSILPDCVRVGTHVFGRRELEKQTSELMQVHFWHHSTVGACICMLLQHR